MTARTPEAVRPAHPDSAPTAAAWMALGVLAAAYALSFLDRQLPFVLAEEIKRDLGLSDTQLGLLTGAMFALVYSTVAIPMARLADRSVRKRLIVWAIVVWSGLTAAGAFAKTFWHLALARMGVAAGESVLTPSAHSIIGDYFAPRYRARALALYTMGASLGGLLGLALGGLINELADWRTAMLLLGAPGLVLALIVHLLLKEPARAAREPAEAGDPPPSLFAVLSRLARQPALVHLIVASMLAGVGNGGVNAFLPAYMLRTFGSGTAIVGLSVGLVWGLGGLAGTLLSGVLADRLRRRSNWWAMAMVTAGELLALPALVLALLLGHQGLFLALMLAAQVLGGLNGPPTFATLQSLMRPNTYATTTAIYLFCVSGIGLALGPVLTGALSDSMANLGPQAALQTSLVILTGMKLWAVVHYALSTFYLRRHDRPSAAAPAG